MRGCRAVDQHVLVARSPLGRRCRGPDVVHIGDRRPLPHVGVGLRAAQDEPARRRGERPPSRQPARTSPGAAMTAPVAMKSLTSWPLTPASGPRSRCGRRRQGSGTTCAGGARRRQALARSLIRPGDESVEGHGVKDGCGHRRLLPGLRSTVTVGAGDLSFGPTTASRALRLTRKQAVSSVRDRITPASDEVRESCWAPGSLSHSTEAVAAE